VDWLIQQSGKGGKNMSFAALVVVGARVVHVGFGTGQSARSATGYQEAI